MDKENNGGAISCRRNPRTVLRSPSPSPRLCRSKSGNNLSSFTNTPENSSSRRFGSSQRFISSNTTTNYRSKSTSKTRRSCSYEESLNNPTSSNTTARKSQEISNSNSNRSDGFGSWKRVTAKSPSAWALSSGRFLGSPAVSSPETPTGKVKSNSNGVSKVLKYFRQKKMSSVEEDKHHRFRILHNRLLQWRFVNARAHAAMVNVKKASEMNLFNVCLMILMLRKRILEKKMGRQNVKHIMKIHEMVNPQLCLLNEWEKMETKYEQHIKRLIRKLSALSICLPFLDIKADVDSLHQAIKAALEVMESMDPLIRRFQSQVFPFH
ncbi:hypothetical protein QN277_009215 [Acacia crassicarpa]|uniref:QWRF motif-containing protein 7 n=1 Tax=Acacia crassicarpa TaxID=499986 RepID=A0AAE1IUP5_9FABA|nr:hypothetical protein QN277_009215 [Acacia crassicarpa]